MPTSRAIDKAATSPTPWRRVSRDALLGGFPAGGQRRANRQLADQFASFATTVQNRLDASVSSSGSLGGSVETQVERAIAQVVRSPNRMTSRTYSSVNGSPNGSSATGTYVTRATSSSNTGIWTAGYGSANGT